MNKMQMAHDYFMRHLNVDQYKRVDDEELISWSFDYVDAMQAEADEREDKTRPKALLTKDKDGKCLHFNHEFGHKKCMDCGASLEEWQPDWSQAPGKMNWFSIDKDGIAVWHLNKPTISATEWVIDCSDCGGDCYMYTSNFGYTGNWQDSLRKRPESIKNIDPKEYIDAVLQDIVDPCDHEWTHISKFGAEGDFYVCPCGAKSKRPQRRTK